jgi:hypothetical protein
MTGESRLAVLEHLVSDFAKSTGLLPAAERPQRYLWTDAFAVCNFLELYRQTGDESYRDLALQLVDQVHTILGRHREDDRREGWISGLNGEKGRLHPAAGGLRIGKPLNERGPNDPLDDRLEWDRDGQYFHYLTKWMHALNRVSGVTGDLVFRRWAIELAQTAHAQFTTAPASTGRKAMYWKMSIDLSYPLVPSMGHHDPLDGLITYLELQASRIGGTEETPGLTTEVADMTGICEGKDWTTDDPLGIGSLLSDAYRLAQITAGGTWKETDLLEILLNASRLGLARYARTGSLKAPPKFRLAFRELGLTIGLHAIGRLERLIEERPALFKNQQLLSREVGMLMRYVTLTEVIEGFWLDRAQRKAPGFLEHRDINLVMLTTSLAPDGYLTI